MLGLILCGGESKRMGSDKGMLQYEGITWAELAADKLTALKIPVQFSVNKMQQTGYAAVVSPAVLMADDDSLGLKGPLLGLMSAHVKNPSEDIFVLACDLPLIDVSVLQQLYALCTKEPQYESYIFTNNNEPEPLCGIYRAVGLAKIYALHQVGELKKFSMKFMLSQLSVCSIPVQEFQLKYFENFNAHATLSGL